MSTRVSKRKKAAAAAAAISVQAGADDGDDTTVQEEEEEATLDDAGSNKRAKAGIKEEEEVVAPLAVLEEAATLASEAVVAAEAATAPAESSTIAEPDEEGVAVAVAVAAAAVDPDDNGPEVAAKKGIPVPSRAKPKLKSRNSSTSESAVPAPARKLNTAFPTHLNPTDMGDFDHFLFQLLASRAENSLSNFTIHKDEYPLLYAWMQFLKKEYKSYTMNDEASQLSPQQVSVLEYLHVPLTSRGDDHWNRFFDLLVAYKDRHGHVLVPRLCEIPGLGDWVTDQRRQYKAKQQGQATQLTDPRQEKLDGIEFVWHVRNRPEWDLRFAELLEYKQEHGDCKVPQHYKPNKALGKWVAKQREQYKLLQKKQHSFLTPYRQEKLNGAGFVWVVRAGMESDMRNVKAEVEEEEANGLAALDTTDGVVDDAIKADPETMEPDEKVAAKEVYKV